MGSVTARHPVAFWGWVQALGGRGGHAAHRPIGCLGTAARLGHCCESQRPATTRPLDLGKWKAIVGNSPCDPRAIERRTAALDSYLRQVDPPSYPLPL